MDQLHVKYFNNMQIARDVTSGSLRNVWRDHWRKHHCTGLLNRLFYLYVCDEKLEHVAHVLESRLLAACRTENDQLPGLSSLLVRNRMERECVCLRGILLELLEMYS